MGVGQDMKATLYWLPQRAIEAARCATRGHPAWRGASLGGQRANGFKRVACVHLQPPGMILNETAAGIPARVVLPALVQARQRLSGREVGRPAASRAELTRK